MTLLLAACSTAPGTLASTEGPVPVERLRQDDVPFLQNSGLHVSLREVVKDNATWEQRWREMHHPFGTAPSLPSVDFATHVLIVAALGEQRSGGFGIYVDSASQSRDTLIVHVRSVMPGSRCGTIAALTQPVDVASIRVRPTATRFVEHEVVREC